MTNNENSFADLGNNQISMAIGYESTNITIDSMIYKTPFPDCGRKFDIGVSINFLKAR